MKREKRSKRYRWVLLSAVSALSVSLAIDVLFIGNIAYTKKWVECGSAPVVYVPPSKVGPRSYPATGIIINPPSFFREKQPVLANQDRKLYCSTNEVDAGTAQYMDKCEHDDLVQVVRSIGFTEVCEN